MDDEPRRVLAYYLQCIETARLKEDLAEDCKLRWHTGRSVRRPEAINEFIRFYLGPQCTHTNFIVSNEPCNPQKMADMVKRYNLSKNPSNAPTRRRRNLNHVSHNEDICNQAESDIGDAGSSLDEDEHQQMERTPPPSMRKQTSSTSAATQLNDCNADETTQGQTETTHLCLQAFGEIRHNTDNTSATVAELTVDAVVKVRLLLFYRLCLLTGLPVFVFIFYERNDDNERGHLPSARKNLYARLQAATSDDNDDVVVDDDISDEIHSRSGMEHTPPPSATSTTPAWVMTPGSVSTVSKCDSVANTSTSRKRQHESDSRSVMNKRKAMRRLRL